MHKALCLMKNLKKLIVALAIIALLPFTTRGQEANWGVGLRLGNPTGLSAKKYLGASNGLELAFGTNLQGNGFELLGHYLFHFPINKYEGFDWYYGLGLQIRQKQYKISDGVEEADFGGDLVIGIEYHFQNVPLTLFTDAVLFIELLNDPFEVALDGGIGIRYRF